MTKIFQLFLPFSMFFLHSPSPSIAATSASWQIKINHQYSTTEVNSRGGETKFKDFIKSEIKRKTNGKNINSSVDSSVKNGRKTFTTTVSSNSSLEDLKQVLFSDLKSEVNLTNVPTELALTHQAAKGQSVQMFIEDNPSTGYSWQFNDTSGHYSVEKPTHYEVKNIMPAGMVGYPQRQVVYLKSNSNSTSTIKLNYKRNWEKEDTVQQIGITLNQISNTVDLVNPTSPSVKGVSTETESLSVLKNAFSKIVSFFFILFFLVFIKQI